MWVPILAAHVSVFHTRLLAAAKGGITKYQSLTLDQVLEFFSMPKGLRRFYGGGDLHFITCSCYQRKPFLGSASRRDLFLKIFEEVRQKYEFQVIGYVVMPEHIHLLNRRT